MKSTDSWLALIISFCTCDFNGTAVRFAALPKIDKTELDPWLIESEELDTDKDQLQLYRDNPFSPHPYPRTKELVSDIRIVHSVPYAEYMRNVPITLAKNVQDSIRKTL